MTAWRFLGLVGKHRNGCNGFVSCRCLRRRKWNELHQESIIVVIRRISECIAIDASISNVLFMLLH